MSHKTGNSGLSGVSGLCGKPEPAESAVPCSLLRQGLKFAWGGAGTNHRSHHYLAKAPAFASGTGELITRCEPPNFFASFSRVSRAPFPIFRGSLKGQRSHVGCHAPAGNVHGAKFCFPHKLTEDSRNLRTNDGGNSLPGSSAKGCLLAGAESRSPGFSVQINSSHAGFVPIRNHENNIRIPSANQRFSFVHNDGRIPSVILRSG